MDDEQNLDDSIDSVNFGGFLAQDGTDPDQEEEPTLDPAGRYEEFCESTVHFGKIKFTWTIKNFLKVWHRDADDDRLDEGQKGQLISRNFPCEALDDSIQFQLKSDIDHQSPGGPYMAVYLVYCGKDPELRANFEIAIIDSEKEKVNARNSLKVCSFNEKEHPAWGFKKFIQISKLVEEPDVFLENNAITLRCTINMVSDIGSKDKKQQMEMEKERLAHPWTKFEQDLNELYANAERDSDVVFQIESREFHGHSIILSAGSPVMRHIFLTHRKPQPWLQQANSQPLNRRPVSALNRRSVSAAAVNEGSSSFDEPGPSSGNAGPSKRPVKRSLVLQDPPEFPSSVPAISKSGKEVSNSPVHEKGGGEPTSQSGTNLRYSATFKDDGIMVINLFDIKAAVFEQVLKYIYCGTIDEGFSPKQLMAAANQFKLKLLQETCEKELILEISKDNILEILKLAETHEAPNLKKHALDFFNKCSSKTIDVQLLATESPSILFDIMQMRYQQLHQSGSPTWKSDSCDGDNDEASFPPATPQIKRQRRQ